MKNKHKYEDVDPILGALRTAHRSLKDLMRRDDFQDWVAGHPETVEQLRDARSALYELRAGRAIEVNDRRGTEDDTDAGLANFEASLES